MLPRRLSTDPASNGPVWNWSLSWNRDSILVNGVVASRCAKLGDESLAGLRIIAVLLCAVSLEWCLPPLAFAGGAPLPLVAPVIACYALSSSYKRMLLACVVAGLLHDGFSPAMPFGSSGLLYLLGGTVAREFRNVRTRSIPTQEFLAGAIVAGTVMLLGHGLLVSSGVGGSASAAVVLRRTLGSAFVSALVMVPLLCVAKVMIGTFLRWVLGQLGALLALRAAWALRHLNFPPRPVPRHA